MDTRRIGKKALLTLLLPGFTIYAFIIAFPILFSLFLSLFKFVTIGNLEFVGFENFRRLFSDTDYLGAIRNNIIIIAGSILGQLGVGYLFALYFSNREQSFHGIEKAVIFFPAALSSVVVGFVWKIVYGHYNGLINTFLLLFLEKSELPGWLDNPDLALFAVMLPIIWQWVGFYMMIFLAGIKAIPKEILEVAEIDGASKSARVRHIIIPLTRSTIQISLVLCIAGAMRVFDQIFVMTEGGPGQSTMVLALLTYKTSFHQMRLGYGNAMSVGITLLGLLFVLVSQLLPRVFSRRYEL